MKKSLAILFLTGALSTFLALAADQPGGGGGGPAGGPGGPGGGRGGPGGGFGGPGGGPGNFDPAQMRQQRMNRYKEQLEITDDTEWQAIQPLIQKVRDARDALSGGMGPGMFGRGPRQGGNNPGGPQRQGFGPQPSPEAEAVQKAIDSKASNSDMKAVLQGYAEYRKKAQSNLEKAQADLRKVLTVRQEAIATMAGLL
jgi:hypothetical protein